MSGTNHFELLTVPDKRCFYEWNQRGPTGYAGGAPFSVASSLNYLKALAERGILARGFPFFYMKARHAVRADEQEKGPRFLVSRNSGGAEEN